MCIIELVFSVFEPFLKLRMPESYLKTSFTPARFLIRSIIIGISTDCPDFALISGSDRATAGKVEGHKITMQIKTKPSSTFFEPE